METFIKYQHDPSKISKLRNSLECKKIHMMDPVTLSLIKDIKH